MRLRSIRWHGYGMGSDAEMRERAEFMDWLWRRGARVSAWMLEWKVRWP